MRLFLFLLLAAAGLVLAGYLIRRHLREERIREEQDQEDVETAERALREGEYEDWQDVKRRDPER